MQRLSCIMFSRTTKSEKPKTEYKFLNSVFCKTEFRIFLVIFLKSKKITSGSRMAGKYLGRYATYYYELLVYYWNKVSIIMWLYILKGAQVEQKIFVSLKYQYSHRSTFNLPLCSFSIAKGLN